MPGAPQAGNELTDTAVAPDIKMRRDTQIAQDGEVGMRITIQAIGEQALHGIALEPPRGQADAMDDQQ